MATQSRSLESRIRADLPELERIDADIMRTRALARRP